MSTKVHSFEIACRCGAKIIVPAPIGGKRLANGWKSSVRTQGWACPDCQRLACADCGADGDVPTDADFLHRETASGWKLSTRSGQRDWRCPACAGQKQLRGFASMSDETRKRIASMGGTAAQAKGTAHHWTADQAREAGRKGGQASRGGRGKEPAVRA